MKVKNITLKQKTAWGPSRTQLKKSTASTKSRKLKQADILWFAEQMATMQSGGIPLYKALGMVASLRKDSDTGKILKELQRKVGDGSTLAAAMRADEKSWTMSVVALVDAGEASGTLEDAFLRVVSLIEGRLRLRKKLRSALTYPLVVVVVMLVLVSGMLLVVVPRFEDIYASLGSELPSITQLVVSLSSKAPFVIVALIGCIVASVFAWRFAKNSKTLSLKLDSFKFSIPILGPLMLKGVYARVSSLLSALLSSGIPLLEALEYTAAAAGSSVHSASLTRMRRSLADGALFSKALDDEKLWPDIMVQFATVGEQSGGLAIMMEKVSKRAYEEVETSSERLTSLIEPLMMVMIGAVIGLFLLALYLPILDLGSQIR